VNEFREDLVAAFARLDETDAQVAATQKNLQATDEKVTQVIARVSEIQTELERRIESSGAQLEAEFKAELQSQAAELRALIDELVAALEEKSAAEQQAMRAEVTELVASLREETNRRLAALEQGLE